MNPKSRVLVLGLDSFPPEVLFDWYRAAMPRLSELIDRGAHGVLRSCDPPITVPAWNVMFTGMDPGAIGLYGFWGRPSGSYFGRTTPTPESASYPPIWETLSHAGRRVCVIGMPPGYPPPHVNGIYVSGLYTPPGVRDFVAPASLADELDRVTGGMVFDLEFRADDRPRLAADLLAFTRKRGALLRHLWAKEAWDLFAVHAIGPDRFHHAFWRYVDPAARRGGSTDPLATIATDYYAALDREIGQLLDRVDESVTVLVVSDHGSQAMEGSFCLNDWLRRQGYLSVRSSPGGSAVPLERVEVDWPRTRAWALGGYHGQVFFNVRGREPQGIVPPERIPALCRQLVEELRQLRLPDGRPLDVEAHRPSETYDEVNGSPPDLILYFGNLRWRVSGTTGHSNLFADGDGAAPDDSTHSKDGVLVAAGPTIPRGLRLAPSSLRDIAPTILALLGVERPDWMRARPIDLSGGGPPLAAAPRAGSPDASAGSPGRRDAPRGPPVPRGRQ